MRLRIASTTELINELCAGQTLIIMLGKCRNQKIFTQEFCDGFEKFVFFNETKKIFERKMKLHLNLKDNNN